MTDRWWCDWSVGVGIYCLTRFACAILRCSAVDHNRRQTVLRCAKTLLAEKKKKHTHTARTTNKRVTKIHII